ncbi:hypothetical protein CF392_05625 [Tamilnaduibacter salinus]|uniref:HicB-like antitoxin of toxin-antitoxin system domain-containing protein n=1 Tax=Tamilnaduibacter salinus TaxID=1484056 RepID=A0A2A2I456_9GAMM|nr:type II toxin-antitoxin system HicB family antitoxin [Tamilnaduibacter salinus]PAV26509.1 hypothetical protein CF392_05625 [Tamilnaduibacter salinus]
MKYPLALHTDDGVAYGVTVPDLPGCFSAGGTLDEAVDNAVEAIEGHLECLAEDGDSIPEAKTIAEHRQNPDFADAVWAVASIDITPFLGKAEKINITVPRLVLRQIDDYVRTHREEAGSRSGFLSQAALRALRERDASTR